MTKIKDSRRGVRFDANGVPLPHNGCPPSDEAVRAATQRYIQQEKDGKLRDLPQVEITR